MLTEGVATRWYRAPEVLLGSRRYDQKADMWSMGCIIAEVMIKNALFPGNSTIQQLEKIMQFTGKPNQLDLSEMDSEIGSTIISQYQQIKTKSHKEYFGNGFDPVCLDLIVNLLQFRASKRLSAEESLRHPFFKEFFKESDLVEYNGTIVLEINDDIKIDTEQYRTIIEQCFIDTGSVS